MELAFIAVAIANVAPYHMAGRPLDEETVLRAAHAYEQATTWHQRVAPV